jgi:hypothetical protein
MTADRRYEQTKRRERAMIAVALALAGITAVAAGWALLRIV